MWKAVADFFWVWCAWQMAPDTSNRRIGVQLRINDIMYCLYVTSILTNRINDSPMATFKTHGCNFENFPFTWTPLVFFSDRHGLGSPTYVKGYEGVMKVHLSVLKTILFQLTTAAADATASRWSTCCLFNPKRTECGNLNDWFSI